MGFEGSVGFEILAAFFEHVAFVVKFASAADSDFEFDQAAFEV